MRVAIPDGQIAQLCNCSVAPPFGLKHLQFFFATTGPITLRHKADLPLNTPAPYGDFWWGLDTEYRNAPPARQGNYDMGGTNPILTVEPR
jgi:hypothetical protein